MLAKYERPAQNDAGDLLPGVSVYVQLDDANENHPAVPIYSDRNGANAKDNPFVASDGIIKFYAPGGRYKITLTHPSLGSKTFRDEAIGTMQAKDYSDFLEPGFAYTFETETSGAPSAGSVRANNADLSEATILKVSAVTRGGSDITSRLMELAQGGKGLPNGITITTGNGLVASFKISTATDEGDYVELGIVAASHAGEDGLLASSITLTREIAGADGKNRLADLFAEDILARDALATAPNVGKAVAVSDIGDGRSAIYVLIDDSPMTWGDPIYLTNLPPDLNADDIDFDDSATSLGASNVQDAIEALYLIVDGVAAPDLSSVWLALAKIAMKQADINNNVTDYIGIIADSFDTTTGLNVGGSTNLDTGEAGAIKGTVTPGSDQTSSANAISGGDYDGTHTKGKAFDNTNGASNEWWSLQTGAGVSGAAYIGQDFGAGNDKHIREITIKQGYTDAGARVNSAKVQYSDNGSSWTDHQTLTLLTDTSVQTFSINASGAHRYWRLLANQNLTSYAWVVDEIEMKEAGTLNAMTAISAEFTLPSEPDKIDIIAIIYKGEAAAVNTDYKVAVSIDGGSNYDYATLTNAQTVGSHTVVSAFGLDVSARTGTSLRYKMELAAKDLKYVDVYVRAY